MNKKVRVKILKIINFKSRTHMKNREKFVNLDLIPKRKAVNFEYF